MCLDEFHFRWLENSVIEIGKAVSNPMIFNHLNWNRSQFFNNQNWTRSNPILKQLEHKRAAENLLAARRERRSIEIAQKQAERDAEQKEAELKAKLVEEERQKLIAKHAQVGFQISASFPGRSLVDRFWRNLISWGTYL